MSATDETAQLGERRRDDNGVWGKLTIPLIIAISVHAGTIIWWARGVQEEIRTTDLKYEILKENFIDQIANLTNLLSETKIDVKANEKQIIRCLIENERAHGRT